jgi:hypothetical protein
MSLSLFSVEIKTFGAQKLNLIEPIYRVMVAVKGFTAFRTSLEDVRHQLLESIS